MHSLKRLLTRISFGTLAAVLVPPLLGLGVYIYAGENQVLPGMTGCRYVRDVDKQIGCVTGEIRELVESQGVAEAMAEVNDMAEDSSTVQSNCHLAWHPIGEEHGKEAAGDDEPVPEFPDSSFCSEGYIHGFYIGYLEEAPLDEQAGAVASRICAEKKERDGVVNCTHSYGHVFARKAGYEQVEKAAEACAAIDMSGKVPQGADMNAAARFDCLYGMYMELSIQDFAKGDVERNNCEDAPKIAAPACYAFLPGRVQRITKEPKDAARACHDYAPKGTLRDFCIVSYAKGLESPEQCDHLPEETEQGLCRNPGSSDEAALIAGVETAAHAQ